MSSSVPLAGVRTRLRMKRSDALKKKSLNYGVLFHVGSFVVPCIMTCPRQLHIHGWLSGALSSKNIGESELRLLIKGAKRDDHSERRSRPFVFVFFIPGPFGPTLHRGGYQKANEALPSPPSQWRKISVLPYFALLER